GKSTPRACPGPSRTMYRVAVLLTLMLTAFTWSQSFNSQDTSQKRLPSAPPMSARGKRLQVGHWNNLGVAYMNRQEFKLALSAFDKAHALDPSATIPELNRAIALLNLQRDAPALQILQQLTT